MKTPSKFFWIGLVLSVVPFTIFVGTEPIRAWLGLIACAVLWSIAYFLALYKMDGGSTLNPATFKNALEASNAGIVLTDADSKILYVNSAWERITGYKQDEVLGLNPRILKSKKTRASVYKKMWNTLLKGESFVTEEMVNRKKSGHEYTTRLAVAPVREHGKTRFYIGIQSDITHERKVRQNKDEFISLASHQLRTPLTAMKWFCEMLLDNDAGRLTKQQKEYVHNIYESNERMIGLVSTLLNISRIESGRIVIEPKPTNLVKMVKDSLKDFQLHIERKKLKLIFSAHGNPGTIKVDPQLIHEVYTNLISNAIKYTPENGEVTILISRKGEEIITQISDTGCGIPKKDHDKIFQRFFRSDNAYVIHADGNGLGLYLVRAIVETSGGRIWFDSEENKGTTFWFTLPIEGVKVQKKQGGLRLSDEHLTN